MLHRLSVSKVGTGHKGIAGYAEPNTKQTYVNVESNYIVVTDMALLRGLNNSHKGGSK